MNLSRTRSDRRDRYLCRFGVMLVICSLLVNMVAVPKAKAVAVVDDVALGAAATAAYLTSTGIPLTVTAGGASAASAGIVAVAGEYAAATGAAASGEALLTTIAAGTALTTAGAVVLTAAASAAVGALAYWVYQTYCVDSSNSEIYSCTISPTSLIDGTPIYFASSPSEGATAFQFGTTYTLATGRSFCIFYDYDHGKGTGKREIIIDGQSYSTRIWSSVPYLDGYFFDSGYTLYFSLGRSFAGYSADYDTSIWLNKDESVSIDGINYTPIPEISPAKQLELDIAAPPELELADLPEFTMTKVAAGDWSQPSNVPHSVTSADPDPVPDPDPAEPGGSDPTLPEDTPDVEDLGLPELGAALITRFPFSIPWDVSRAIKLIAAPAEAPYWEVDFLSIIGHRFPGSLGDTKIVLDFGEPEYEIIGIASRWTSTIGFCLALAAATKRFIWTA